MHQPSPGSAPARAVSPPNTGIPEVDVSSATLPSVAPQTELALLRQGRWRNLKCAAQVMFIVYLGHSVGSVSGAVPRYVKGASMAPTIQPGDILQTPLSYGSLRRGDSVIFFQAPFATLKNVLSLPDCTPFVKRLVGLPGDTVIIRDGELAVNGEHLSLLNSRVWGASGEWQVPPEHYFVLGDNTANSIDSRRPDVGFVPTGAVRQVRSCCRPDGTPVPLDNPWINIQFPDRPHPE